MVLLIVDDNPAIRRLIGAVVADLVDDIHECSDGSGALDAYRQHLPDLVLMDVEMKEVDGISAARQISTAYPDAIIVMLTQHAGEPLRAAAREAGACGYMLKENLLELRRILRPDYESLPSVSRREARASEGHETRSHTVDVSLSDCAGARSLRQTPHDE